MLHNMLMSLKWLEGVDDRSNGRLFAYNMSNIKLRLLLEQTSSHHHGETREHPSSGTRKAIQVHSNSFSECTEYFPCTGSPVTASDLTTTIDVLKLGREHGCVEGSSHTEYSWSKYASLK
jgi:hypothetical protein